MAPLLLCALSTALAAEPAWHTPGRGVAPQDLSVRLSEAVVPQSLETSYAFTSLTGDLPWFPDKDWTYVGTATRIRVGSTWMFVPSEERMGFRLGNIQIEQWVHGTLTWQHGSLEWAGFLGSTVALGLGDETHALFVHGGETVRSGGPYVGLQATLTSGPLSVAVEASHGGNGSHYASKRWVSAHGFYSIGDKWAVLGGGVLSGWMHHAQGGVRWRPSALIEAGLGVNVPLMAGPYGPEFDSGETFFLEPMLDVAMRF